MVPPRLELFLLLVIIPSCIFVSQAVAAKSALAHAAAALAAGFAVLLAAFSGYWIVYVHLLCRATVFYKSHKAVKPAEQLYQRQSSAGGRQAARVAPEPPPPPLPAPQRSERLSLRQRSEAQSQRSRRGGDHSPLRMFSMARIALDQNSAGGSTYHGSDSRSFSFGSQGEPLWPDNDRSQHHDGQGSAQRQRISAQAGARSRSQPRGPSAVAPYQPRTSAHQRRSAAGRSFAALAAANEIEDPSIPEYLRNALRSLVGSPSEAGGPVAEGRARSQRLSEAELDTAPQHMMSDEELWQDEAYAEQGWHERMPAARQVWTIERLLPNYLISLTIGVRGHCGWHST